MQIETAGDQAVGRSFGVHTPPPIHANPNDYFEWVEPFRDLTFEEFKAREVAAEAREEELRKEFGRILEQADVGSLIQTGDGKWWRVAMVQDGFNGERKKAIVPDKSGRASRRAEIKTKKRKFR